MITDKVARRNIFMDVFFFHFLFQLQQLIKNNKFRTFWPGTLQSLRDWTRNSEELTRLVQGGAGWCRVVLVPF